MVELRCAKDCPFGKHCGEQVLNGNRTCEANVLEVTGATELNATFGYITAKDSEGQKIAGVSDGQVL